MPRDIAEQAHDFALRWHTLSSFRLSKNNVFSSDGEHFRIYDEPVARHDPLSIRWPVPILLTNQPVLRAVLNQVLTALGSRDGYAFSLRREDGYPLLLAKIHDKWRNQFMIPGDWVVLVHGELARAAMHAERRVAQGQETRSAIDRMAERAQTAATARKPSQNKL